MFPLLGVPCLMVQVFQVWVASHKQVQAISVMDVDVIRSAGSSAVIEQEVRAVRGRCCVDGAACCVDGAAWCLVSGAWCLVPAVTVLSLWQEGLSSAVANGCHNRVTLPCLFFGD